MYSKQGQYRPPLSSPPHQQKRRTFQVVSDVIPYYLPASSQVALSINKFEWSADGGRETHLNISHLCSNTQQKSLR